jgi:diguanylate cyclase (GGDEF)-like protein
VILPDAADAAPTVAERLRAAVESLGRPHPDSSVGPVVTISVGAAVAQGQAANPSRLVHAADELLYRAKQQGRNRVAVGHV